MSPNVGDSAPTAESATASTRSTVVQHNGHGEKTGHVHVRTPSEGGEGESAIPDDKREEALERLDHDWQHDHRNPRNWTFRKKWTMAGIVRPPPLPPTRV